MVQACRGHRAGVMEPAVSRAGTLGDESEQARQSDEEFFLHVVAFPLLKANSSASVSGHYSNSTRENRQKEFMCWHFAKTLVELGHVAPSADARKSSRRRPPALALQMSQPHRGGQGPRETPLDI